MSCVSLWQQYSKNIFRNYEELWGILWESCAEVIEKKAAEVRLTSATGYFRQHLRGYLAARLLGGFWLPNDFTKPVDLQLPAAADRVVREFRRILRFI